MKKILWLSLVYAAAACSSGTDVEIDDPSGTVLEDATELTLQQGEEKSVEGSVLTLSFVRVMEDSRCPVDVTCVWAGNAVVEVGIRVGMGPTVPLQINATMEPRHADWNDLRVTVLELLPEPRSDIQLEQADYSVRIRVEARS